MTKRKTRIGIDLDLTTVDSDQHWLHWLVKHSENFNYSRYLNDLTWEQVDYNLSNYFTLTGDTQPLSFWSQTDTYDNMTFLSDAKRVITGLYKAGFELVFISYCMGCSEQIASKIKFLKREFPFLLPDEFNFVPTKKKHLVNVDYLIDDRNQFLTKMDDIVKLIKMNTPYTQEVSLDRPHTVVDNWLEIEDYFCNVIESEFDANT